MTFPLDALTDHFRTFVSLLDDPSGGAALQGLYHPEAMVITRFDPQPIATVGSFLFPLAYQSSWEMYEMNHPGGTRKPSVGAPTLLSWRAEGDDRGVAWWQAPEREDGRTLTLATGYRFEEGAWALEWLTLAEAVAPWTYAQGLAHTLADHEYAHANLDITPRSWLDLAYYRLYGHEKPEIGTLPEARFTCGMSSVCCSIDYRITVRPGAQAFIDAVPWETMRPALAGTQLPEAEDDMLLLKDSGTHCRFLDENRHCVLHKAFGRPVFNACTQFPLRFAATPDGVIVAGSPMCGAVRSNLGPPLAEKQAELQARLAVRGVANLRQPRVFHVTRGAEWPWEDFRAVEACLLEALAREDLPLRRRLWLGSRLLAAVEAGAAIAFDPAWEAEPLVRPAGPDAQEAAAVLEVFARGLDLERPAAMHGAKETPGSLPPGWLPTALRNLLFAKTFSYAVSLTAAHHVNVLTALMVERLEAAFHPAPVPEPVAINLVMRINHGQVNAFLRDEPQFANLLDRPWLGAAWLAAQSVMISGSSS